MAEEKDEIIKQIQAKERAMALQMLEMAKIIESLTKMLVNQSKVGE